MRHFVMLIGAVALFGAGMGATQVATSQPDELKAKKLSVQELELTDSEGKIYMRAKVSKETVIMQIGAGPSQLVLASNKKGSQFALYNCNQLRSYWATDVRQGPKGDDEPGVTEQCFFLPKRDPKTLATIMVNGEADMKEVFGIEAHDGHSPGLTGNPETWVGMRMTNGGIPGDACSPVFEAYSIPGFTPMDKSVNQPYLKAGNSYVIVWGKDQPMIAQLMDGNHGDKPMAEVTIDGKECPYRFGTTSSVLNPPPPKKEEEPKK